MLVAKKTKLKKNKSKPKKQRTFTSSEFSIPQDGRQLSMSELFRNDALKRRQPPPVLVAAPVKKNRSQKQLQTTKKRTKSRSKLRLDKCQTYEVIPYKNSLNSEIVFSNQETKRQGSMDESSSELAIRVNQQYLIDNNRQLRISIKKEYQKKVEAAIKIQKVFRGFLTRKVLQHCMEKQQRKLHERLVQIRSQSVSQHSSYFADKENYNNIEPRRRVVTDQQGIFEYSLPPNAQDSEQEEQEEHIGYRHHQPIYSHDQISGYLESSEEEDDFDHDAFQNNIIFETNQEYIDSRKSSQQPRNKLSRPGLSNQNPVVPQPTEAQPNPQQSQTLVKTEKKQQRMKSKFQELEVQIREQTLKLNEQSKSHKTVPNFQQNGQFQATLKDEIRGSSQFDNGDCSSVQRLKQQQVQRWDQIIELVQSQINRSQIDNSQITSFMQQIMQLSLKNKKVLEISSKFNSPNKNSMSDHSIPRHDSKGKLKTLRAHRHYLTQPDQISKQEIMQPAKQKEQIQDNKKKDLKNLSEKALFFEEAVGQVQQHSNAAANPISPLSSFDNTGQLKRFLQGNVQDEHIDDMLRLRQDLLKKREIQQMRKLNLDLESKSIDQTTFLSRLQQIQKKYSEEKFRIDRTKQDISRGYRAALRLTKQAVNDAKKLGYDLPISRSVEGLKYKSPLLINDIIIDQLSNRRQDRPKQMPSKLSQYRQPQQQIHIDLSSDAQSSDLQFTEEELRRFRRAQPYDIQLAEEIADLGRNVMISQQLLRQQQVEDQNHLNKTQHVFRQIYQIEETSPPRSNPHLEMLTEWITNFIIFESAGQFMLRPIFSERLIDKSSLQKPLPVSDKQRLTFLSLLEQYFPSVEILNTKLNQKISPLPSELLRCMRIDFSQEDEDQNSYEQIGKYEFIIGQDVCNEAIKTFRQDVDSKTPIVSPSMTDIEHLGKQYNFNEKLMRYLQQRQKYICNRRNHTRQLRWQVLNIEIHCIFDAWNEQLIYLRSQKAGYSGIGLNQLTLSVHDHNWLVSPQQTLIIVAEGKKRLIRTLSLSSPALLFPEVVEEQDDQLLDQDSKWIFYADQALSYGLELVYLIEEEIFNELAKELRKKMLQFV